MTLKGTLRAFIVAALAVPGAAQAQEQQPPAEVQEWIQELQQIQSQLAPVQERALQDSAVAEEQARTSEFVLAAIVDSDPEMEGALARFEEILTEARAAQESGDAEQIAALTQEAQQLQPRIQAAQEQVMAQPAVAERVALFQQQLQAKMVEIDPEARTLLDRAGELEERIAAVMR